MEMFCFCNSEVVPAYVMSHGVPIMTKYMVAMREVADIAAANIITHAGEIVGVIL